MTNGAYAFQKIRKLSNDDISIQVRGAYSGINAFSLTQDVDS